MRFWDCCSIFWKEDLLVCCCLISLIFFENSIISFVLVTLSLLSSILGISLFFGNHGGLHDLKFPSGEVTVGFSPIFAIVGVILIGISSVLLVIEWKFRQKAEDFSKLQEIGTPKINNCIIYE